VDGVAGETVAMVASKLPDEYILWEPKEEKQNENFFSQAQEVLDTVEWKAEP